jgi:hypothetical protein
LGSWVDPLLVQIISVPLFQLTILKFRQVWLSHVIPLVPHGRENWPVIVLFLFSGPALQLDCCRVSYDSRARWWRGCWVTYRDFFLFGCGECSGVAPHLSDGSSAN